MRHCSFIILCTVLISGFALPVAAEGLGEGRLLKKFMERRQARQQDQSSEVGAEESGKRSRKVDAADLPQGTRILKDVAYGKDPLQTMDVYIGADAQDAPILIMVHGGGWKRGDKGGSHMVTEKVNYWQPKGFIYVSVNYRMHPQVKIPTMAKDVASALAMVQDKAPSWGGDPDRVVMMGHSAGAHLVALISADPGIARSAGASRWSGTVVLDSALLDAVDQMSNSSYGSFVNKKIYAPVLGDDPAFWEEVSPLHRMTRSAIPTYIVCASTRKDACPQGYAFAKKSKSMKIYSEVLEQRSSHGDILGGLGKPGSYTDSVDRFIERVIQ